MAQSEAAAHTIELSQSFVSIDFETATSEWDSACAVGAVMFEQGKATDTLRLMIRPPDNRYDDFNTMLHGIGPSKTRRSPAFPAVWDQVAEMINGRLVIAHNTAFDISVLRKSAERYGYKPAPFKFACSYRLARSAMPDATAWTLDSLARDFRIRLKHHDPLSDARAAGLLWLALPERLDTTHEDLLAFHGYRLGTCDLDNYKPFSNAKTSKFKYSKSWQAKDLTPTNKPAHVGLLFGKRIVFTGTLKSMSHREAFQAAADADANPRKTLTNRTDYLVVGATSSPAVDVTRHSTKHRQALAFIAEGNPIKIIDEEQYLRILADIQTGIESITSRDNVMDSRNDTVAAEPTRPKLGLYSSIRFLWHGGSKLLKIFHGQANTDTETVNLSSSTKCSTCHVTHDPVPGELLIYDPPYEWCETVKVYKRSKRYDEALAILDGCMLVTEAHRGGVAPWYYEQAAIIHRKRRDRDAELSVLRRFATQEHAAGAGPPKLLARLAKLQTADTTH